MVRRWFYLPALPLLAWPWTHHINSPKLKLEIILFGLKGSHGDQKKGNIGESTFETIKHCAVLTHHPEDSKVWGQQYGWSTTLPKFVQPLGRDGEFGHGNTEGPGIDYNKTLPTFCKWEKRKIFSRSKIHHTSRQTEAANSSSTQTIIYLIYEQLVGLPFLQYSFCFPNLASSNSHSTPPPTGLRGRSE